MENVIPTSKTAMADYDHCAWYFHAIRVLKRKKEVGMAAMNGIAGHRLSEQIITGELDLPSALTQAPNSEVRNLLTSTNTWWPYEKLRQAYQDGTLLVEETVYTTQMGRRVKTRRSAILTAIIDLAIPPDDDGVARIYDWKSGKWERDDERERHLYAGVAGRAMFPDARAIIFALRFMRSGNSLRSIYTFSKSGNTALVTNPARELQVFTADENPFLQEVKTIIAEIKAADPIPRHGAHCKKHYGQPCQFYADGTCPHWAKKLKEK